MDSASAAERLHRPLGVRTVALLLASAFFFALAGDVLGAHVCPHHDRLPGGSGDHAAVEADAAAPAGHEGHANARAPGPEGQTEHSGPCTCIGPCNGTSASPPLPSGSATVEFAGAHLRAPLVASGAAEPVRRHPYVLPYSNGPPLIG